MGQFRIFEPTVGGVESSSVSGVVAAPAATEGAEIVPLFELSVASDVAT